MSDLTPVIGLEVHVRLRTATKLFCPCPNDPEAAANTRTCAICAGWPGALPLPSRAAVVRAARAALALGAALQPVSVFARKHYFYDDLPKGYQITQGDRPLALGGALHFEFDGARHALPLTRLHLEEDAGRATPEGVDLNRAGVPLVEIVSAPALESPAQAEAALRMLHRMLVAAGVTEGAMERGQLRCDANVSLRRLGEPHGTRVEIKNVNSFRFVRRALEAEIARQQALLEAGAPVARETRAWDGHGTAALRGKESTADYRWMDEPDLAPLALTDALVAEARAGLAGAPLDLHLLDEADSERRRWVERFGLTAYDVEVLTADPDIAELFRRAVHAGGEPRAMSAWIQGPVLARLKERPLGALGPGHLVALERAVSDGVLNRATARGLLDPLMDEGGDLEALIDRRGLRIICDVALIRDIVHRTIASYPQQARKLREGHRKMAGFFMGRVMAETGGRADPQLAMRVLTEALEGLA
ncbi:MAG: Asp-tRNA(Asn)/Glu-tRNA(Gln) amidotransferase subunit GatB [Alphaproteobacteria bacterium]|nr:Asp-tRNA(Asn)/Glu-tRNA(Gln) amidotransferase subunit GatB [Alphaproteobacteria bacterium]